MPGSIRHVTIWGVWITGVAALAVSGFSMLAEVLIQAGMNPRAVAGVYAVLGFFGQLINLGFVLALMIHLYAVNRDLILTERSLEAARHGIGLTPLPTIYPRSSTPTPTPSNDPTDG